MAESVVSLTSCSADLSVILLQIPNNQRFPNPVAGVSAAMTLSPSILQSKEKTIVKRVLLVLGAALLFLNTLVVPTVVRADGGGGSGTNCGGNTICKP
jgi:hypothetical protein